MNKAMKGVLRTRGKNQHGQRRKRKFFIEIKWLNS